MPHADDNIDTLKRRLQRSEVPIVLMIPLDSHFFLGLCDEEDAAGGRPTHEIKCDGNRATLFSIDKVRLAPSSLPWLRLVLVTVPLLPFLLRLRDMVGMRRYTLVRYQGATMR